MNIKTIISAALGILLSVHALGQNNVVSNAIQAFADGDYQKTYELSKEALANLDNLSGDYVPAAYYYLAKSRVQVLRLAMESGDKEKLQRMQNALIESYYDYKEALKTADNKLKDDINIDLAGLYNPILQTGLSALNTGNDPNQPYNVRQSAYRAARGYLGAAKDISPTYLACDLYGQSLLATGDTAGAYSSLNESIDAYKNNPPASPDFLMAYVFFRKAVIERYSYQDPVLALGTLVDGENLLNMEYSKHSVSGSISAEDKEAYNNGLLDLIGFELDIYIHEPSLNDEALIRFQEVLMLYPEDYDVHVAYASLLENVDLLLAIDAYETAISIDESRELAYFNLGAVYNNLGSELYMKGLNVEDDTEADSLYNEANMNFRNAYRYMEAAYRLNPYSMETVMALMQLASTLGLDGQAEMYKEKAEELRGF